MSFSLIRQIGKTTMTTLDGREVYTRRDLMTKYGMALSPLEEWYRNRRWTGHPEAAGKAGRELVWDAAEWDHWYQERQKTTNLVTRADLEERHGLARSTLERLWALREENEHPAPVKTLNRVMYWDLDQWEAWYADYKKRTQRREIHADRSGNPDDLLTLAEAARVLGVTPVSLAHHPKRMPRGWPHPAEEEQLPSGRLRRLYRRADIWTYADTRTTAGPHRKRPSREPRSADATDPTPD
ncbi:helix-turn-helix transcriptional regulator [Streptomyces lydicus]|uniref:helix-turn-helix transcriptional regulator n=1 Tax=Streptomyces lydicus TaxID=47763 RepID=UPI00379AF51C